MNEETKAAYERTKQIISEKIEQKIKESQAKLDAHMLWGASKIVPVPDTSIASMFDNTTVGTTSAGVSYTSEYTFEMPKSDTKLPTYEETIAKAREKLGLSSKPMAQPLSRGGYYVMIDDHSTVVPGMTVYRYSDMTFVPGRYPDILKLDKEIYRYEY